MTMQLADGIRNAMLDAIETWVGTSPILRFRSGAKPATVATASSGTVLAEITLGSDWAGAASGGAKTVSGVPLTDSSANATGTAGHWELVKSDGTTVAMRGDVGLAGSGASAILSSLSINSGSPFSVLSWGFTAGNA